MKARPSHNAQAMIYVFADRDGHRKIGMGRSLKV